MGSGLPATGREAPQASARLLPLLLSENKQTDIYLGDNVTTQSLFLWVDRKMLGP